jgi:hypothetical protein
MGPEIVPKSIQNRSFHSFVFSKGAVTSAYGRAFRNYNIFEGTSEIQRLITSRTISGVHIR